MSNPYLPEIEYVPDGEPHVFEGRLYIFGSHDKFKGLKFCEEDYVAYSSPIENPSDFRYEGIIYKKTQHPGNEDGKLAMYAPDVVRGNDGRYYLYYSLADYIEMGVAVSDTPSGKYEFLGLVHDKSGVPWGRREGDILPFDPGVINDDGTIYLYAGQGPMNKVHAKFSKNTRKTAFVVRLEDDMVTMKEEPKELLPSVVNSKGTGFEGHEFFEANSIRKFNGKYYFIYSSVLMHELVYAMSDRPDGGFKFCGRLTSSTDFGYNGSKKKLYWYSNNHGSIEKIGDRYYVFGHRHTNMSMYSRQGYADLITINEDGTFNQAPRTSNGLEPIGRQYRASSVSHLYSKHGTTYSFEHVPFGRLYPYVTQEEGNNPYQYVTNMRNGSIAGFRGVDMSNSKSLEITIRGNMDGKVIVLNHDNKETLESAPVSPSADWKTYTIKLDGNNEAAFIGIKFIGKGKMDFLEFKFI